VLPFQNMSGDAEQEYFADGVVEEIITALSRFHQLFVIARNSSFTYKGRAVDVKQVGRELGVRYVLEGSVRKAGNRLRITGQLIDAGTGNHLWADRFDGALDDIFDLQDKITMNVIGAIEPKLRQAEIERARNKRPENLGAYDCVMRAMPAFWSADAEARKDALRLLERAIAIDPRYALAKALAAWCHAQNVAYHGTPASLEERSEAIRLAEEAARLDSEDPMVLTALGAAYSIARRTAQALPLLEKALLLNPNSAWTWQRSGWLKLYLGQYDPAIEHFDRSIRISPLDVLNFNAFFGIGCSHFGESRYEEAVVWLRKAISARPSAVFIYRVLASALAHLDRLDEAQQAVDTFRSSYPDVTISKIVEALPMNPPDYVNRFCEGIRKAGLPE
jgi:adenylate cyclase